jgi:hypothetical protein
MNIRLMCLKSPRVLGIIDISGQVHLDKLEEHVHACAECRPFFKQAILDLLRKIIREPKSSHGSTRAPAI